ncbi:hypothetical protein BC835DRAFT_1311122 [Cytidiella melzeri]|nr:hypothetical protein BC835DRAFT_1311122 [Cytidiella melzeri]
MQLSTSLIIFSAIVTGALHTVEVSAIPCSGTDSRHPTFSANLNSLQRRSSVPSTQGNIPDELAALDRDSNSPPQKMHSHQVLHSLAQKGLFDWVPGEDVVREAMNRKNGPPMTESNLHELVLRYIEIMKSWKELREPLDAEKVISALKVDLELLKSWPPLAALCVACSVGFHQ